MALVSMRQLLDHAAEVGYGLPAFNVNNLEQMRAMVGGNSDLRDEMRALRAVLEDFSASNSLENGAVATATGKIARILERVTPDNDALSVRTAA